MSINFQSSVILQWNSKTLNLRVKSSPEEQPLSATSSTEMHTQGNGSVLPVIVSKVDDYQEGMFTVVATLTQKLQSDIIDMYNNGNFYPVVIKHNGREHLTYLKKLPNLQQVNDVSIEFTIEKTS